MRSKMPMKKNKGTNTKYDPKLARDLILDELLDLTLYRELRNMSTGSLRKMFDDLIPIETEHHAFWEDFFSMQFDSLDARRRFKLRFLVVLCRLFGEKAIHIVLEGIEIYGVKKYLRLWEHYKGTPLGDGLKTILEEEFRHEDMVVSSATAKHISSDRIRNVFLGLNDGLVEILGAISGFFAAFGSGISVLIAGITVAVAGAISMGAGSFVAISSEREVWAIEDGKRKFLGEPSEERFEQSSFRSALTVGLSYIFGAAIPLLPLFLGIHTLLFPLIFGALTLFAVSFILAFISGMEVRRRILINILTIAVAVGISYGIGLLVSSVFGIAVG